MVFQDYALWPHLTALDNVAFALRRRRLPRAECRARAAVMLERVGLADFARRYPNELSGGQQQRVALARALIADTGLILCDEPLSNLDADLRERMRVEISSLVREAGATTVYITHDQAEAFALADHIGVLEEGVLVQAGTPGGRVQPPGDAVRGPVHRTGRRAAGPGGGARQRRHPGDHRGRRHRRDGCPRCARPAAEAPPRGGARCGPATRRCSRSGRPGSVPALTEADERHLTGRVADVAFRGRGYEYAIDLPGLGRLTGVFARHRASRGDEVGVRLEPDGCHLFPADVAPAAEAAAPSTSVLTA